MTRIAVVLSLIGLAVLPTGSITPTEANSVATVRASEDAFVTSAKPTKNYGATVDLRVRDGSPTMRSYLKFDVGTAEINAATLRLWVTDGSSDGGDVFLTDPGWSQGSIQWSTAPAAGARVGGLGRVSAGTWAQAHLDVSALQDGVVSLVIQSRVTNRAAYASRETTNPPELVITTADPGGLPTPTPTPTPTPSPTATTGAPGATAVLVGAGDIATCSSTGDEQTAALLDGIEGTIFTTGDSVYPDGTAAEFAACYEPSWGRHKTRTRPSPGNHDYHTPGADGYYTYFGSAGGPAGLGYYAYDLGDWRVYALNSNCDDPTVDCNAQLAWLQDDLRSNPRACVAAYWHHPLFSSGRHGGDSDVRPLWEALYAAGAELVLTGHDHDYERFAPMSPAGTLDESAGIRQFVVGTGGAGLRDFLAAQPNSEVRYRDSHGVLRLDLSAGSYQWSFIPTAGNFTDTGSGSCH